ncbi:MAG: xylose isomerase [Planctomycetes bacterium]|nr:xylose isomerase [Planctomycetota bacterium]
MKLSLSVRVAKAPGSKEETVMRIEQLIGIAAQTGYDAVCMRASQIGIQTPVEDVTRTRQLLTRKSLQISMVTGDFPIPINDHRGPDALRNITPYLDLAEMLEADLIRIAMKKEEDIVWAQRSADEAVERQIRVAHQSHTKSLFETVEGSVSVIESVARPNFGLIYEPSNLMMCGQTYGLETLKRFAPYLFNVYLQNYTPDGTGYRQLRLQDKGGINFDQVFEGLDRIGYHGYVTVHDSPLANTEQAAIQSHNYLKQLIG